MMNENVTQYWLPALRSGKYKQRVGWLGGEKSGYCVLGVGCRVYEEVTGDVLPKDADGNYAYGNSLAGILYDDFEKVRQWLGLKTDNGSYNNGDNCLSNDNDNGKSLSAMAGIIENNHIALFE